MYQVITGRVVTWQDPEACASHNHMSPSDSESGFALFLFLRLQLILRLAKEVLPGFPAHSAVVSRHFAVPEMPQNVTVPIKFATPKTVVTSTVILRLMRE